MSEQMPPPIPSEMKAEGSGGIENDVVVKSAEDSDGGDRQFGCEKCGADLAFEPGKAMLVCPYCEYENQIALSDEVVKEQDFEAILSELAAGEDTVELLMVKCEGCGAEVEKPTGMDAFDCAFCGLHLVKVGESKRLIKPKGVLPFRVGKDEARAGFEKWVKGLWFAPNKVKEFARADHAFKGVYLPHWTYDTDTTTSYTGQRGEHYWVTEHYTTTDSNGKSVRKSKRVRKTRWYSAWGTVYVDFDDVLVVGSRSLPTKYVRALEPWDLGELVAYQDEYLSGFIAESYQVDVKEGFDVAKGLMEPDIRTKIKRDIGGDEQRIFTVNSQYDEITFKHILLPVWSNTYRYQDRVYRIVVNARTGEVQGERPWSWVKIMLAVMAVLIVLLGLWLAFGDDVSRAVGDRVGVGEGSSVRQIEFSF
ncbi:hypothetical protein KS4_32240 [Poriferisphaera corsica]|uniref:Replication restart DNA helicase PriA n=1 Tax=Poriferisphaera corsica TaxID=2528020 RepID=A0A517YY42_9BACT|nr:hypothetical protein [Poriferisphaera corsica]QDU35144.1 hypothetical protein KS4_32240 [Poriferisphaera corsica]